MKKNCLLPILFFSALLATQPARATLKVGAQAPEFTATAAKAGKAFSFVLADALKRGPVVLYFYPAAFTPGCTVEAHLFAEAIAEFEKAGATVLGMSRDDIGTLSRFSVEECKSKFALAADHDLVVAKAYDALMAGRPGYSSRTSYVIAPDGRILSALEDMKPAPHVETALAVVRKWRADNPVKK